MIAPALVTDRLLLRAARPSDLDDAAAMWADEEVVRFIGGKTRTRQEVWFALLRSAGLWPMAGYGYWVICDGKTGEFLGEAGFADFQRGLPADLLSAPEAGWAFARRAWGRGLASEALAAMHAWLDTAIRRQSTCIIDPGNAASARVAEKLGYIHTGETLLAGEPVRTYRRGA